MANSGTTSGPELLVELDRGRAGAAAPPARQRTARRHPHRPARAAHPAAVDAGAGRGPRGLAPARRRRVQPADRGGFPVQQARFRHPGGHRRRGQRAAWRRHRAARRFDIDFAPGSPDLGSFPRHAWLRALRQGLAEIESHAFGYVAPQGLPAARVAVADYLRRTRGVLADPQNIVLCSGATQAIALLAHVLRADDTPLAMEDPGFWLHRMVLATQRYRTTRRARR